MPRKSKLDQAVDRLEQQLADLTRDYEAARSGLEYAISAVRGPTIEAPKRTRRPRVVATSTDIPQTALN